jgi:hypothetical protein
VTSPVNTARHGPTTATGTPHTVINKYARQTVAHEREPPWLSHWGAIWLVPRKNVPGMPCAGWPALGLAVGGLPGSVAAVRASGVVMVAWMVAVWVRRW